MMNDVFVVPIKAFTIAKGRLRVAGAPDVSALARTLASRVLAACAPRPVIVLSESEEVTTFARDRDVEVVESNATSLNEAVAGAYGVLAERFERLIIVHGDLLHPEGLGRYSPSAGVTIVTDHHGTGTNVLVLPTGLDFHFCYGPHSAHLHQREARRLNVALEVVHDSPWRFDVDEPSDLG